MYTIYSQMVMLLLGLSVGNGRRTMAEDNTQWGLLERKALRNDTQATPDSIPPSQYWEGNDGPWSAMSTWYIGYSLTVEQVIFHSPSRHTSTGCAGFDIYCRLQYLDCKR